MTLDEITGLPVLEPDQFWRVTRDPQTKPDYTGWQVDERTKATAWLQVIGYGTVVQRVKVPRRFLGYRFEQVEKQVEVVIEERPILAKESFPHPSFHSRVHLYMDEADTKTKPKTDAQIRQENIQSAKKKFGPNAVVSEATFNWTRRLGDAVIYMGDSESYTWVTDNTVNAETILRTAREMAQAKIDAEAARVAAEEAKRLAEEEAARIQREAEIAAAHREAEINFFVGDYPPRILFQEKKVAPRTRAKK